MRTRMTMIKKSHRHILRPDFQTFVLIFPNDGRINLQQLGREFAARAREQTLGILGGVFKSRVVISRAAPLAVVPMRDGVDGFVLLRPRFDFSAHVGGDFLKRHERLAAMLADQARLAHVAREQRQERRAAARRFRIGRGGVASRLNQICFSCAICAARRYAPTSGCESRHARPSSWPRVCASQRASVRSSQP